MLVNFIKSLFLAQLCVMCMGYEFSEQTGNSYKFHTEAATWTAANSKCQEEGATLAVINSDTEAQVLKALFQKYKEKIHGADFHLWAGIGYYREPPGGYKTVDGQTLEQAGYAKWGKIEKLSSFDFGFMLRDGKLATFSNSQRVANICEKEPTL